MESHRGANLGVSESARRVEHAIEVVRGELGKLEAADTDWVGLSQNAAMGAARMEDLARELAGIQAGNEGDPLVHLFMLRQLEISLSLISRLSREIASMQERLDALETHKAEAPHVR